MLEQVVKSSASLESRNAAMFVQTAGKFKSNVRVNMENKTVNAKSIMGVMALSVNADNTVNIVADGEDEQQAVKELSEFIVAMGPA